MNRAAEKEKDRGKYRDKSTDENEETKDQEAKKFECMCGQGMDCGGSECGNYEIRTCYQLHCTTWPGMEGILE